MVGSINHYPSAKGPKRTNLNKNIIGGFYKCALSDFEIVFEDKLKVVE